MASRKMLSNILKSNIQSVLKGHHPVKRVLVKNSSCIANAVYRKFSTSSIRESYESFPPYDKNATEPVVKREQKEITEYVNEELKKNWVGFGYYPWDKHRDTVAGNLAFFIVAASCVVPIFIYNYLPDYAMQNWAHREAYLVLKEREDAGIFPISKDFLDPERVKLPSDEELGDIDIRI